MERKDIVELFKRYQNGTCTEAERSLLEQWYLQYNEHEPEISSAKIEQFGREIYRQIQLSEPTSTRMVKLKWLSAAAAAIILFVGVYLHFAPADLKQNQGSIAQIKPGKNQAVLTLANGRKINLNDLSVNVLIKQTGTNISKPGAGLIAYKPEKAAVASSIAWNTLTTPVGGQWQLVLPDGTHVWLNNASSITYPESFINHGERVVKLTGEAYFEVAKDKKHPFIVQSNLQEIEVLGTHFNVNSYDNEPSVKTTLFEGSVKISASKNRLIKFLKPGQQASVTDQNINIAEAHSDESRAWKDGYFRFNDENIQSIMRKLSRWYDIEVSYSGMIPNEGLNGKISRSKNISQVLAALEATKTVHFKMEGRRITVMK